MKLTNVTIHKYKSYDQSQSFPIDNDITIIVGKNESGKTAILEAIAKTNYFSDDGEFKFNPTHDYPRKEKRNTTNLGKLEMLFLALTYLKKKKLVRLRKI